MVEKERNNTHLLILSNLYSRPPSLKQYTTFEITMICSCMRQIPYTYRSDSTVFRIVFISFVLFFARSSPVCMYCTYICHSAQYKHAHTHTVTRRTKHEPPFRKPFNVHASICGTVFPHNVSCYLSVHRVYWVYRFGVIDSSNFQMDGK